jgi:hypothetical protein
MKSASRLLKTRLVSQRRLFSISKSGFVLSTLPPEHFKAGLSAQQGYGYYPAQLGECIGEQGHFSFYFLCSVYTADLPM